MTDQMVPEVRFDGFEGEWTTSPIGGLATRYFGGGTPSTTKKEFWHGTVPWIQSSDVTAGTTRPVEIRKFITSEALARSAAVLIPENSIAVVTRVGVGKVTAMRVPYATSQDFVSLAGLVGDVQFSAIAIQRRIHVDIAQVQGSVIKGITVEELLAKQLSVPGLEEQRAIGNLFSQLDKLINTHESKHARLKQTKASLMQRMFPQGDADEPELRFEGFTGPWGRLTLREFDIKTGPFGSALHAEDYVPHGTPIVTTEHFKSGHLPDVGTGVPQVSVSDTKRLAMYLLEVGDIVFSRVGSVDLNAVVTPQQWGWLFSGRVLRVRPTGGCDSTFLHYALDTDGVRQSILARAVGQTMPSINTQILGATEVPIPASRAEQQAIGTFFSKLDALISAEGRYVEKLKQVKAALLHKMFV